MNQSTFGTRDGFQLRRDHFILPTDASALDPKTKRAVTICNLFLNHQLGLREIVRLLDEDSGGVVLALLEQGIVYDRRSEARSAPDGNERRKSNESPK